MLAGVLLWTAWAQAQSPAPSTAPDLDLRTNGTVQAVARQPDGGVVFGGDFALVNGVPRRNIARLLPDGTLDPDWNPSANSTVWTLAVAATGAVYAGGEFTQIGGLPRSRIARLSGSGTGAADPVWNPSANIAVYTLAVDAGGTVYAGGFFTQIGGQPRSNIARLSGSGTGPADPDWNPSANSQVLTLAVDASGAVYAGGFFTEIGGLARSRIAKLSGSGTGSADPDWNPSANNVVRILVLDAGGALYAGGAFGEIGGLPRSRIAKLSGSGTGAADPVWDPAAANGIVVTLALDAGGALYAGGNFSEIGGLPRNGIAKLSGSGTGAADPAWDPSADSGVQTLTVDASGTVYAGGSFTQIGGQIRYGLVGLDIAGAPAPEQTDAERGGHVLALATQANGGLVVGGLFHSADGQLRGNLLRLRPDRSLDPDWNPTASSQVQSLAVDASSAVYAGGQFTQIGGLPRNRIAKLSGNGTGTVDPDWNPSANGTVVTLAVDASGAVYAGGAFTQIGGAPRNRIAKLSGSGAGVADPDWNPSASTQVHSLAVDASGAVYAGGEFTEIGALPRNRIAKLSGSGTGAADPDWDPSANSAVRTLAVDASGAVYAGGPFIEIGGLPRNRIAKLSGSGSGAADPDWDPSANGIVWTLAVDAGGTLYAGGQFTQIGGLPRVGIARLSCSGSGAADPAWDPSADGVVWALAVDASGTLYAGGEFAEIGGLPRVGLAAFADIIFASGFEPAGTALR